ncbi:unnamed protein product [Chrysodeixis includens]|uniref:Uncharacterized protein n=1 Tax=Chrysodeixis includens TaxID=689277 RepID=A0A9P0BPJ9_CHRIL|nr:unnamed protein product [Chrysodeixis includens]
MRTSCARTLGLHWEELTSPRTVRGCWLCFKYLNRTSTYRHNVCRIRVPLDRLRFEVQISPVIDTPSSATVPVPGTPATSPVDGKEGDGASVANIIVVIDRSERRAIILDIIVLHVENLMKAEKEKQLKYLDLAHEVVSIWEVDSAIIVPIVVAANGLIAKSLNQHLQRLSLGVWVRA